MAAKKPAKRRTATRRKGAGSGIGAKVVSFAVLIISIGGLFAFMSINGITSVEGVLKYFRGLGRETSEMADRTDLAGELSNICNFVEQPSCLYGGNAQQKIGDLNGDGKIDDADSDLYAQQHGVDIGGNDNTASTAGNDKMPTNNKASQLVVADADDSRYVASEWPHWSMVSDQCDAREQALRNAGLTVDDHCRPAGGSFTDPYGGGNVSADDAVIVYKIPLEYAQQHGAASWSSEQKKTYANDESVLVATSASEAGKRGDSGPFSWKPRDEYRCSYANDWVDTAVKYGISVTQRDKTELESMIEECS